MPKLWTNTIETHRHAVREATIDAVARLVAREGLALLTMSRIAAEAKVGRATLYKHFKDLNTILVAWHERQVASHLHQLAAVRDQENEVDNGLEAVLEAYALMVHQSGTGELAALLHQSRHASDAQRHVSGFIRELLIKGARTGKVRDDVKPDELATYCLSALGAASQLPTKAAIRRLVSVTVAGLRRPR